MKKCPFCETENEDNATKCVICGSELPETTGSVSGNTNEVDNSEVYSVLMPTNNYKWIIKLLKKRFHLKTKEAKEKCLLGQVDGLSKQEAEDLVMAIRQPVLPVRAVKSGEVEAYKAKISKDKVWRVKIFSGEDNPDLIAFYGREFDFGNDTKLIKDHLFFCIHDGEGEIFETDCEDEAISFAAKVRNLGIDAMVDEGSPDDY